MSVRVVIGPPGTGKTTRLLRDIGELLDQGCSPENIAFLSFSRSAVREARERAAERFGLDPDEAFPNFRTIHSTAKGLVGGRAPVMNDQHWKDFSEVCHYDFSEDPSTHGEREHDGAFYTVLATAGDALRQVDQLSRLCMITRDRALLRVRAADAVTPEHAREFSNRLREYKAEHGLIDFTDMLEMARTARRFPMVEHAFVDEAQDCCRLHHELIDHWFAQSPVCRSLTYAGDDDQAIHVWAGAEPALFQSLCKRHPSLVLDQSYRIPALVHTLALSIIRQVRSRVPKEYRPRDAQGRLTRSVELERALDALSGGGPAAFLIRNHFLAAGIVKELVQRGELYHNESGAAAPLDRPVVLGAWRAVLLMLARQAVRADWFRDLMELVPSKHDGHDVLPHGVKKAARENRGLVTPERLRSEFGMGPWLERVGSLPNRFGCLMRLGEEERRYLDHVADRMEARGNFDPQQPLFTPFTITTMHRSKGRQWPQVAIEPTMANASYQELQTGDSDSEHRAAYVAATRAQEHLVLLQESNRRSYPYDAHVAA